MGTRKSLIVSPLLYIYTNLTNLLVLYRGVEKRGTFRKSIFGWEVGRLGVTRLRNPLFASVPASDVLYAPSATSQQQIFSVSISESVENPRPNRPWLFQPGKSGNPGGQAKGARRRLTGDFLSALSTHFEKHGVDAIDRLCKEDPRAYVGAIVKLCPRELEVANALDELDSDALRLLMAVAQSYVTRKRAQAIDLVPVEAVKPESAP